MTAGQAAGAGPPVQAAPQQPSAAAAAAAGADEGSEVSSKQHAALCRQWLLQLRVVVIGVGCSNAVAIRRLGGVMMCKWGLQGAVAGWDALGCVVQQRLRGSACLYQPRLGMTDVTRPALLSLSRCTRHTHWLNKHACACACACACAWLASHIGLRPSSSAAVAKPQTCNMWQSLHHGHLRASCGI
jgi:hypothetical protein